MSRLSDLPNVGKVLEQNLRAIGVETPEQLRALGSEEVFIRIRMQKDPEACLHMLYGIQGAIEGIPDQCLAPHTKARLKRFFNGLAGKGREHFKQ